MNFEQARFNMIEQQIRPWDVLDGDVLGCLSIIKREDFVPAAYKQLAFVDMELPLKINGVDTGEAMLAPKTEARILQEISPKRHETVLEIGAGSGYMAALLAYHARHVTTLEIRADLTQFARDNLQALHIHNVLVEQGNGAEGLAKRDLFDVIVLSGAVEAVPSAILTQLKVGGRLAAFVGNVPLMRAQIITRQNENSFTTRDLFETQVPLLQAMPMVSHFKF